jgi:transcriptional regulator with XRE-family HTH domain
MDYQEIGKIIREIRISLNMSQQELARDICTQGNLSRIEKGEIIPNAALLYELSQRLNVEISYFFKRIASTRNDYTEETCKLIRKLIRERDYLQLKEIIGREKRNPQFQHFPHRQFLQWHEGIVAYYVDRDLDKALDLLHDAIQYESSSKFYTKQQIEIMNSIGILHYEEQSFLKSIEIYEKCLRMISHSPLFDDYVIKTRIHYNISKSYYKSGHDQESLVHTRKGIQICLANESLYLLGELYFQHGLSLIRCHRGQEKILETLNHAVHIFELQKKTQFTKVANETRRLYLEENLPEMYTRNPKESQS